MRWSMAAIKNEVKLQMVTQCPFKISPLCVSRFIDIDVIQKMQYNVAELEYTALKCV
jgi:hypothetical protein